MNPHDPRRFVDANDTPPVLRDALAAARARAPSDAALARLAARLPLPGGPGGAGPSDGAPNAAPAASGSTLSGAAIGAALGILVVSASLVWQAVHEAPSLPDDPAAATAPATLAASPSSSAPLVSPGVPRASATAVAARRVERPAAASAVPASEDHEAPAPVPEAAATAAAAPVEDAADAETEAHFLDRARAALNTAPAQALALTGEHARRFPSGALGQEREVVAIEALSRLGRADEARGRAQRFLAAFPGSVHRRRIEALFSP